jgi:hypothetical protein
METIKLKQKKKKKIMWKKLFIILISCAAIAGCAFLGACCRIRYKYYIITPEHDKIDLGISKNRHLVDDTIYAAITEKRLEYKDIADYSLNMIINDQRTIAWVWDKTDDAAIQDTIVDNLYVIVYATKITVRGDSIFVTQENESSIVKQIQTKNKKVEIQRDYLYTNINSLSTDEEIKNFIDNI